ncbi:ABC-type spermidine/putrescine transport system permease subunit II [Mesorhizobium sangaii]|uniref:ABC-type spermidine/putrescine transport system permease subunit II n=1 Tax=Mesorhizobium sangaii TaxID=505389 RepID=A0A841PLC6_9HYPH|nr:ABC-type spermidine/putrescine transport system permease subunit II [Mesorhizobium sangaii]
MDFNLTPVIAVVSTIIVAISILLMGTIRLFQNRANS